MNSRHIPQDQWCEALDTFSRQHEGWIVNVAVSSGDGQSRTEARNLPLQGVSCDAPGSQRIAVMIGNQPEKHLTHEIARAVAVAIEQTDNGADGGIRIRAADGSETHVEFRSPMRADQVDGVAKP
jgi:Family of unknown function (DUF5335)